MTATIPVVVETAPKRIWLQVDSEAFIDEHGFIEGEDQPFPPVPDEYLTWCQDSIGGLEVEYVRSDQFVAVQTERDELRDALEFVIAAYGADSIGFRDRAFYEAYQNARRILARTTGEQQ